MMKFCMIGWCGHSAYLFPGLKRLPALELSGIAGDDTPGMMEKLARNGITCSEKHYDDWKTMLNKIRPDAVLPPGQAVLQGGNL